MDKMIEPVWFMGVIEDRMDPLEINRVKVRCFGYHTKNKENLSTDDLPWATVVMPTTASGNSGIGQSPHFLIEGSWVFGFFKDGNDAQDPVVLGSIASIPNGAPESDLGFFDPNGNYPKEEYINASDVNFLARGEDSIESEEGLVSQGAFGRNFSAPGSSYGAKYPFNHVFESEAGHVNEYDDTPGNERIRKRHAAGTYYEMQPDGSMVLKVVKNRYAVVLEDDHVQVFGDCNISVAGEANVFVKGDMNAQVLGNTKFHTHGDREDLVKGNYTITVEGDTLFETEGKREDFVGGDYKIAAAAKYDLSIGNDRTLTVGGNTSHTFAGDLASSIAGNENRTISGNYIIEISGNRTLSITGDNVYEINGNSIGEIGGNRALTVSGDYSEIVEGNKTENTTGDHSITAANIFLNPPPSP